MGKSPMISVVMAVYNGKKFLAEAIESILNQTWTDFEFIIVNDGSRDNSLKIINRYAKKDSRIVVISRKNMGLVQSLNEGIAIAKGEYLARIDADDIALPTRFEKQVEFLKNHPDISILGTFIKPFGDSAVKDLVVCENWFNPSLNPENVEATFLDRAAICHPSIMGRTELFKSMQYRDKYYCAEDYDLWLRSLKAGYKIWVLDEILLRYRIHKKSKTNTDAAIPEKTLNEVMNIKLDYFVERFDEEKPNCLIWGGGSGGERLLKALQQKFKAVSVIGYVDSFKSGTINGVPIYHPEQIKSVKFDFIFLATITGKTKSIEYLTQIGLKPIRDFVYVFNGADEA